MLQYVIYAIQHQDKLLENAAVIVQHVLNVQIVLLVLLALVLVIVIVIVLVVVVIALVVLSDVPYVLLVLNLLQLQNNQLNITTPQTAPNGAVCI